MSSIDLTTPTVVKEKVGTIATPEAHRDEIVATFELIEKRVIACSFLVVKIVSMLALVVTLVLLEASVIRQICEIFLSR